MACLKYRLSVLFCLLVSGLSTADNSAKIQPLANQSLLLAIVETDQNIIMAGERGHILSVSKKAITIDQTKQIAVPIKQTLTSLYNQNNTVLWAVGHDASILKSIDSGQSWQLNYQDKTLEKPLLDVLFFDPLHGIAIGAYGLFLRTEDGGTSWQSEAHIGLLNDDDKEYLAEVLNESEAEYKEELNAMLPHLNQVRMIDNALWLVGERGLVAYSVNKGKTWQRVDIDYYGSFFTLAETLDNKSIIIAGLQGNLFIKQLKGDKWRHIQLPDPTSINALIPNQTGFYVLNNSHDIWQFNYSRLQFKVFDQSRSQSLVAGILIDNKLITVGDHGIDQFVIDDQQNSEGK